ncbi:MAG TPA: FecR domain-containing protein [Thermoanaerobaculia bacterium]|nr:FecR domain-containing protein [Thermoanaerobaculia bacterium]
MANKKKSAAGSEVDWYLISIARLKQIGVGIVLLILAGGGWWYYAAQKGTPRNTAESAIGNARQALNALASSPELPNHRSEFDRAQKKLEEATSAFAATRYTDAQSSAVESQTISRAALNTGKDRENDAQFLTVEGDVQFQKSSTSDWKKADARTPLFNGDWVKTSDNASAELIFSNGSLYTIGPNALLEIYSTINPATSKKSNAVQMQVGSVEIATTDDASTVRTPGSQVVVDSESTTQVGVDRSKQTSVVATKGSAQLISATAGAQPVKLSAGEKVSASSEGDVSQVKKVALPPALATPADNQVFQLSGEPRVAFSWQPVAGAKGYLLEVSRSRLFSALEINSKRQKTTATAKVSSEGTFYWRVASIGPDGETGSFAPFRRFRVSGSSGTSSSDSDKKPPALHLLRPYPLGGPFYMIEGTTEPGATVLINDEEVDVDSSGHFKKIVSFNKLGRNAVVVKAINPAGVQAVQSETVLVEE